MKTEKAVEIIPPEGYEVDKEKSTTERIVFKAIKDDVLPRTWEELEEINGYYVRGCSMVCPVTQEMATGYNRNIWPTQEEAEASIALAQLCQLRDRYNGRWRPDWKNVDEMKYRIFFWENTIETDQGSALGRILSFKSVELRDKFLENFRDLIEKAKPLL